MYLDPPKKQVRVNVYVCSSHEGVMSTLMMGISIGESRLFKALAVTKSTPITIAKADMISKAGVRIFCVRSFR